MQVRSRSRLGLIVTLALVVLLVSPAVATPAKDAGGAQTVVDVEFLGEVVVPTGTLFDGTEIGGLSSITFDSGRRVYYTLSDDQGNRPTGDPVRYYTVAIDLADGTLDAGDVEFVAVTQLFESRKIPFPPGGLDPEGFALGREGFLFMSSEGNIFANPIIDPFIKRYNRNGRATATLPVLDKYIPNGVDHGVRFNLSFESLNVTPNGRSLVTAGEGALFQDGPASTFTNGSLARILVYDLRKRKPISEYVYEVAPWAEPSGIFGVNGIVEVLPIDDAGTMLVMERSFSVGGVLGGGTGNVVVINEALDRGRHRRVGDRRSLRWRFSDRRHTGLAARGVRVRRSRHPDRQHRGNDLWPVLAGRAADIGDRQRQQLRRRPVHPVRRAGPGHRPGGVKRHAGNAFTYRRLGYLAGRVRIGALWSCSLPDDLPVLERVGPRHATRKKALTHAPAGLASRLSPDHLRRAEGLDGTDERLKLI